MEFHLAALSVKSMVEVKVLRKAVHLVDVLVFLMDQTWDSSLVGLKAGL